HPGSAGVPSAYMFSRGARSSSISVCLLDRGRTVRKRYHSLLLYPPQLLGSEPGQLFHGQAPRGTFLLDYSCLGQSPHIKEQIVDMAMNASRIRDTARVLHVSGFVKLLTLILTW